MGVLRFLAIGTVLGAVTLPGESDPFLPRPARAAETTLGPGRSAPTFTLPDVDGQNRSLSDCQGRPVALYFFCGCQPCQDCARAWGQIQRSGALPLDAQGGGQGKDAPSVPDRSPVTLAVFLGDAAAARAFAAAAGLDPERTVLLPDPKTSVTLTYRALPCPRIFVLDRKGVIRYTNNSQDDAPPKAPAPVIVSRTLDALRAGTAAATGGQASADVARPPGLTVVDRAGVQRTSPAIGRYDLGAVDPLATPRIERTFTLRNDGKTAIVIARLQASCGCSSVLLGADKAAPPKTLAPGQQVDVRVSVEVAHLRPGPLHKSVWAYVEGSALPAATMEMTARLQEVAALSPAQLNFGRTPAGTARSLPLTVTLDPRLLASGALPRLACSNPNVQVVPDAGNAPPVPGDRKSVARTYTVTLSPRADRGVLTGTIFFAPTPPGATPGSNAAAPMTVPAALTGVSASLAGEVIGRVSAMPGTVAFGTVAAGQEATRQITLSGTSPGALKSLTATCASPWLSARLSTTRHPETTTGSEMAPTTLVLDVTLSARTPPGGLETQVIVTAADGERLVLPVLAYITSVTR